MASALGGGATYDTATGGVSAPSYEVGGNSYHDVGSAIGALDQLTSRIDALGARNDRRFREANGGIAAAMALGGTMIVPDGTVSVLGRPRPLDNGANFSNWMFTSVVHMGEDPNGNWTLNVADEAASNAGTLTSWSIAVRGYIADNDQDNDGILDTAETNADSDSDGTQNYLDTDSDNDTILDVTEGTGDVDSDTTPNYLDLDSDGDGFTDFFENQVGSDPYNQFDVPSVPVNPWPVVVSLLLAGMAITALYARRRAIQ